MRFFIALEIPAENRQQLQQIQIQLKGLLPQVKLTNPEKLHLTIAFIGEQPDQIKPLLINAITESVKDIKPFEVTPSYLDGFPNIHEPHIIWVGVKGDIDKLVILRERIKDNLASLNLGVDHRRFEPHIAIAKVQNFHLTRDLEASFQQMMLQKFDPIQVSFVKLFESIPNHGFHSHNTLAEIQL